MSKKQAKQTVVEVKDDITKEDLTSYTTKSSKIRFLLSKNYGRKDIAVLLGIRYQHVRNVEVTLLKKDIKK